MVLSENVGKELVKHVHFKNATAKQACPVRNAYKT